MKDDERNSFLQKTQELVNQSPFYKHIGLKLLGFEGETSIVELNAEENLTNIYGTLHGGNIASLIDSACGTSLATKLELGEKAVTLDLKITFFSPAKVGRFIAKGKMLFRGKNIAYEEAEVFDSTGKLLAKGCATHYILKGF